MADESSSAPSMTNKPVFVRVKRKAFQCAIDAFWLEINERPIKRPLLDFGKLTISDASSSRVEELKTKKILVRHVETVTSSDSTSDVLRYFVPNISGELKHRDKAVEGKRSFKTVNKQDQILVKAKQRQEVLSRNARFEQIWRSRKEKNEAPEDEAIYDMCRLYDVIRVDVDEKEVEVEVEKEKKDTNLDDHKMMAQYLPLLRDVLPSAAVEIESDIHDFMSKQAASSDCYVYDFYAVNEDADIENDSANPFPLVQVDDDDEFYDGPDDSEYESDDSNGENHPLNQYPDEETSSSEAEVTNSSSDENSECESSKSCSGSLQSQELDNGSQISLEDGEIYDWMNNEMYSGGDDDQDEDAVSNF